ncbi:ABC transporter ATP-binding protein [Psychromonas marina]|uniref:ABC transporter ATP-binding protein n=1 Tax=Psychromonas marina TaxID=88364 RepID=A0ABQ6E5E4_9GAMM|nr:ATP-binding cassette domain-containing protein [Psychromonas marina]GLS92408.1 ABC transporter ATP-binding protein [Psychromonas marina]
MSLTISHLSVFNNHSENDNNILIDDFSVSVDKGTVLTLMGPSGSGKSTLLSIIAGFVSPDFHYTGEILLNQKRIGSEKPENRNIGILFQDDLLFPHLSVCENLMVALPNSIKGKLRREIALQTLQQINLQHLADRSTLQISGGQKARVSVMRLLLAEPHAVLLDEPFSKLDKSLRSEFRDWLFTELKKRNLPTILVTHDNEDCPIGQTTLHWPWHKEETLDA